MSKKEKAIRIFFSVFFTLLGVWLLLPILFRVVHAGFLFIIPIFFCFCLAAFPRFYKFVFKNNKKILISISLLMIVGFSLFAVVFGLILSGASAPTAQDAGTIIVLGCRVDGDEPSSMLMRRADAALSYLQEHPACDIIVTGSTGRWATISEAEAIKRYLVNHGVDENRIYLDEYATNTDENLKYSADIIRQNNLSDNVVIATDRFHQYRAARFAQKYGLTSSPLPCTTEFAYSFSFWCREVLAVIRSIVFGY